MTQSYLTWKGRRKIIDSRKKVPLAEFAKAGRELQEAGWLREAVEFFKRAEDWDALRAIRSESVASGDFFLYNLVSQNLGEPLDPRALKDLAANAEERGLGAFALSARAILEPPKEGATP
ncbi:MAG: hypothetical protein LBO66_03110 [Deltaproteobacteria bacterium]|jgi:hypothetical protein|nr:hypothetical protein [Deltaproteobacteria bacterium]